MEELRERTLVTKKRRKEWKEMKEVKIIEEKLISGKDKELPMVRDPWDHGNLYSRRKEEEEKTDERDKEGKDAGEDSKVKFEVETDMKGECSLVRDPPLDPCDYGKLHNEELEIENEEETVKDLFGEEKRNLCFECVFEPCICDIVR